MPPMIPMTRPWLDQLEYDAVTRVLESGMLVQGAQVQRFEELVAARCQREHAVAVSSGTAALSLALSVLGVGPGDEVLVPALTWPSPAHAVLLAGARVKLVDVDPDEWNAAPAAFAAARSDATRAAIVIDQFGNPVRAAELRVALEGLLVVEDAACAIGSVFADGSACGSLGDVSCLSFHPRKILTTGEGGVCLTDDAAVAHRLRVLRNHGQAGPGVFEQPAGNYRLTEMGGALGVVQMGRLDAIVEGRRTRAAQIKAALREAAPGLTFQQPPEGSLANAQTLGALLPAGANAAQRDAFIEAVRANGAQAGALSYALGDVPTIASTITSGSEPASAPSTTVAADIVARGVSLPLFPTMTDADVEQVVHAVRSAYAEVYA